MKAGAAPRSSALDAFGWVAVALMVLGPVLAWMRIVPGLAGFGAYALGGILALAMGISALVASARGRGFGGGRSLALLGAMIFIVTASAGFGKPRINDFTTDVKDPPAFHNAASIPANAGRDLGYPAQFAQQQESCCADLRPARLHMPPDQAFARAKDAAQHMPNWEVMVADPQSGTIEAVATSRVFGFHDDIVIRVRGDGDGSRVDMRSKSRDGQGDLGANAERIRGYVAVVEATG